MEVHHHPDLHHKKKISKNSDTIGKGKKVIAKPDKGKE